MADETATTKPDAQPMKSGDDQVVSAADKARAARVVEVKPAEVLAVKIADKKVTVVTVDGRKLRGTL